MKKNVIKTFLGCARARLVSMEEVFMSNIVHRIPDQSQPSGFREMTMGEGLKQILLENKLGRLLEYTPEPIDIEVEQT